MAYGRKFRKGGDDKYLKLTGMWKSKNNEDLYTGRVKDEYLEQLQAKIEEAIENDSPIVFSIWKNRDKESRRDPDLSLQCFVGDSEEKPRSRRDRDEEEETPRKKKVVKEEEDEAEESEETEEEVDEEEKPKKSSKKVVKKSSKADW